MYIVCLQTFIYTPESDSLLCSKNVNRMIKIIEHWMIFCWIGWYFSLSETVRISYLDTSMIFYNFQENSDIILTFFSETHVLLPLENYMAIDLLCYLFSPKKEETTNLKWIFVDVDGVKYKYRSFTKINKWRLFNQILGPR